MATRETLRREDDRRERYRDDDRDRRPPPRDRDERRERDREDDRPRGRDRDERPRDRERSRDRRDDRPRSSGGARYRGYQRRSEEDVRRRADSTGGVFDSFLVQGVDMFRPKVGENIVRFLPATWDNPKHYGLDIFVHAYVGTDESSYLCLDKMRGERCPICVAAKAAKDSGDDDEYKALRVRQRILAYVLDRNADDSLPLIYDMSWTFDHDVAALCKTRSGALYIDHDEEGYDLTFTRRGSRLNTRYFGMQIDREPTPILQSQREQAALLDQIAEKPIPSLLKFYPPEHLQRVIEGASERPDEDLDDERDRGRGRDRDREEDSRDRGRGRDRDEEEESLDDERSSRGAGRAARHADDDRPRGRRDEEDEPRRDSRASRHRDGEETERPARTRYSSRGRNGEEPRGRERATFDEDERDRRDPDEAPADEEAPDARPRTRRSRRDDDEIPF